MFEIICIIISLILLFKFKIVIDYTGIKIVFNDKEEEKENLENGREM